jgi:hypothetical protein
MTVLRETLLLEDGKAVLDDDEAEPARVGLTVRVRREELLAADEDAVLEDGEAEALRVMVTATTETLEAEEIEALLEEAEAEELGVAVACLLTSGEASAVTKTTGPSALVFHHSSSMVIYSTSVQVVSLCAPLGAGA